MFLYFYNAKTSIAWLLNKDEWRGPHLQSWTDPLNRRWLYGKDRKNNRGEGKSWQMLIKEQHFIIRWNETWMKEPAPPQPMVIAKRVLSVLVLELRSFPWWNVKLTLCMGEERRDKNDAATPRWQVVGLISQGTYTRSLSRKAAGRAGVHTRRLPET